MILYSSIVCSCVHRKGYALVYVLQDQRILKAEANASKARERVLDTETERLKQQNLRLEWELASKKRFLLVSNLC